jgi:hypothetical protein
MQYCAVAGSNSGGRIRPELSAPARYSIWICIFGVGLVQLMADVIAGGHWLLPLTPSPKSLPLGLSPALPTGLSLPGLAPLLDAPLLDAPLLDAPLLDAPLLDAPLLDAPLLDAPLLDAPLLDAPLLDAPLLDAPLLDAPLLDAPLLDAPLELTSPPLLTVAVDARALQAVSAFRYNFKKSRSASCVPFCSAVSQAHSALLRPPAMH